MAPIPSSTGQADRLISLLKSMVLCYKSASDAKCFTLPHHPALLSCHNNMSEPAVCQAKTLCSFGFSPGKLNYMLSSLHNMMTESVHFSKLQCMLLESDNVHSACHYSKVHGQGDIFTHQDDGITLTVIIIVSMK